MTIYDTVPSKEIIDWLETLKETKAGCEYYKDGCCRVESNEASLSNEILRLNEEIKLLQFRKDTNIVQCILLSDIDCFGTYEELSEENYKIAQKNGFVLNGKDEDGKCMYVREDTLV